MLYRRQRLQLPGATRLKISIIIPVYREESIINNTIESIKKIKGNYRIEIIVADGGTEEETIRAVRAPEVIKLSSKKNLGAQLNKGGAFATGDILLFLHADTLLPETAFMKIESAFNTGRYGAGAFSLGINSGNMILRFIAFTANIRNYFTSAPYGDQAIFIKKELFIELGGYKEIPIMHDVDLMKRIKKAEGPERIIILKEKALTSPRRWEKNGILINSLKNNIIRILYFFGVSEKKLAELYY